MSRVRPPVKNREKLDRTDDRRKRFPAPPEALGSAVRQRGALADAPFCSGG